MFWMRTNSLGFRKQHSHRHDTLRHAITISLPELLFGLFPLVIVTAVMLYVGHGAKSIFSSPEWGVAASILFGQALIRFVCGVTTAGRVNLHALAVAVSALIVLGFAPCLVVLAFVLHSHEVKHHVGLWLMAAQLGFFVLSSLSFLVFGGMGTIWSERHHQSKKEMPSEPELSN